ncbi:class I SAM-dependent methyltransferase [Azospirillum brasilense]|uniref:Class I SAM-dependent methyltransferase n=1 Tax=Azospirillum brasilense TaxID=192 RepID=A0A6L3ASC5_AZOBR|nr:class I SAM-dependent methyltransferase [Azospirillum brasilense]KAA0677117.1 class I SAM-dependent methyltransferase [Azospirillum brasilense]
MADTFRCRSCGAPVSHGFVDLGETPLANSYVRPENLGKPEARFPLRAAVCGSCFLVQLDHNVPAEHIFDSEYAYFSSYSESWLAHAKRYSEHVIPRFGLGPQSLVMEVASNDGYLLRNFVEAGIPVLGIEPTSNTAEAAEKVGVRTRVCFFHTETGRQLAAEGLQADLIAANNVMAHVPDLADFVGGFAHALKPEGVLTVEFPHLLNLIEQVQFDTIYHEHYSYLSLLSVEAALGRVGIRVFDVQQLPTHGGSLRVFACREGASHAATEGLALVRRLEAEAGFATLDAYTRFGERAAACREGFRRFLAEAKAEGKVIAAYGAAAKGNTFLNYCGTTADDIAYVVDRNPHKQGRYLPGSLLPILGPEHIAETKPDYLVILPWNLRDEIMGQMANIREWGGRFVTAVPEIRVFD